MFKKLLLILSSILALCSVYGVALSETWHSSTVRSVYPLSDGNFVITFNVDSPACQNANTPRYMYVSVGSNGVTVDGAKKMFATALMAFALEKPLVLAFNEATSGCEINRLAISN